MEINVLFGADDAFDTPKPERLLMRIFEVATKHNDLIIYSFLGSGTYLSDDNCPAVEALQKN